MSILESGENYLECILMLKQEKGFVRSVDIANKLGFSKPSVSVALKKLKEGGFVVMESDNLVELTQAGLDLASKVYDRHLLLSKALESLGVSPEVASADACRVEHVVSEETMNCIRAHMKKHKA